MKKENKKSIEDFEDEIKQKANKYFIKQKLLETTAGLGGLFGLTIIPYYLGRWLAKFNLVLCETNSLGECISKPTILGYWFSGLVYIVILGFLGLMLVMSIRTWLKNNWRKARSRAVSEIRIRENIPYK